MSATSSHTTTNSSPPKRARVSPSRTARLGAAGPAPAARRSPGRVTEAVVDQLEVVDVEEQHAHPRAPLRSAGPRAWSSRSVSSRRLGSPVTGSWSAWWAKACSTSLRSVMSVKLTTIPPTAGIVALVGGGQLDPAHLAVVVDHPQLGPLGSPGDGLGLLDAARRRRCGRRGPCGRYRWSGSRPPRPSHQSNERARSRR